MKFENATAVTEILGISSYLQSNNVTSLSNGHTRKQLVTREYCFELDCSFAGVTFVRGNNILIQYTRKNYIKPIKPTNLLP